MTSRRILKGFIFLFIFTSFLSHAWAAAGMREFSAEMVMQGEGQSFQGKIYVGNDKTRLEMPQSIVITRIDRNVSWVIMPSQGMYMEQAIDQHMAERTATRYEGETERVSMGKEAVNGEPAEKFRITYTLQGSSQTVFQWMGKHEIPLRIAAPDGSWSVEYRNVQVASQPEHLFEVPDGYQKFAMPSMGNMAAMMNQAGSADEN